MRACVRVRVCDTADSTKEKCACVGLRPRGEEDTKLQASVYDTLGGRVPESEAEATINQCSEHSE